MVGDLVKVSRDEDVPCDIVILYSETPGCCYVTTSNLDGETNLKVIIFSYFLLLVRFTARKIRIFCPQTEILLSAISAKCIILDVTRPKSSLDDAASGYRGDAGDDHVSATLG